jgi:hypothetical protein
MVAMAKKKKARKPLSITDAARIKRRLLGPIQGSRELGFVCSEAWADVCIRAAVDGIIQIGNAKHVERDLYGKGIYPPGGRESRMVEDGMRFMPPDITGVALDAREDRLSFVEGCKLPPTNSGVRDFLEKGYRPRH